MNKKVQRLLLLVLLLFLLIPTGITLAWFAVNRITESSNMRTQLNADGLMIESYSVYQYDYDQNDIVNIYNLKEDYQMTAYDSIFEERNSNTLLIFEVMLYHFQPDSSEVTVYVDRAPSGYAWNDKDHHFASNLLYIKAETGGTLGINPSSSISSKFYAARDAFAGIAEQESFVKLNISTSGLKKTYSLKSTQDRVTLTIRLTEEEKALIADEENGSTVRIPVYFIFDYDEDLVQAQDITHFGEITLIENATVDYRNDITSIIFEE